MGNELSGVGPDARWWRRGGARGYLITQPIHWSIGRKDSGWIFTVPEGKEFESSVPRALRWFWSPHDPHYLKAAAVHDTLLETGFRTAFADSQWFEAALSEGAPNLKTQIAYTGMRFRRFFQKR